MVTEVSEVNLYAIVGTSAFAAAVVSAGVNTAFGIWAKRSDRRREDEREAKKMGHVYLSIALSLEAFTRRCSVCINDIDLAFHEVHASQSLDPLKSVDTPSLTFDPDPAWNELPIRFVSEIKGLVLQFDDRGRWIAQQFQLWADFDDAYALETERLAFFGQRAVQLAEQTCRKIDAKSPDASFNEHFESVIERRRELFRKDRSISLIFELKEIFEHEIPNADND